MTVESSKRGIDAPLPARWIYRLLVLMIAGEAAQLVLAGMPL